MASYSKLPLRIRKEIEAQQYTGELLVAGVQLGVIILLSIINLFSSAGYSPGAPVQSSSLGLWLFAILVLVRLWFVYTNQLNPIFLGFFIVAEMALLLFIIWTYYLQFETTPTINLKNPHINYVYILIALRALRFEPGWVVLSGLTAALGWGIIAWQTLSSSGMNVITWDYVTFASTRSVYLGAVFDVILSVLLVTTIIALVLMRAKHTLFQAVEQTSAAKDLSRFFDTSVVEKITTSEKSLQAGYGELRQAAIMFIDMRGFTKASVKLSPSELIGLLAEYQRLLVPIIQKNNGSIDKFMGDGILASFGAVTPSNTYAADALRTVDEIVASVDVWSENRRKKEQIVVGVGIGLASGEVVVGVIGYENRLEYTVIGEAANLAAKLEKHNKEEKTQALTTRDTFLEAVKQGYENTMPKKELNTRNVGGVGEPLDLVVLAK
ncbi:TPA: adenylate/guanylate cyclase domain-containing protein [Legionella pneumophila]|nr:adenylate/guanylate cyclase domain-containing protein [Legionella pneumophila]HAU1321049.1 adenylate/guanylate cyclase domain-containing protein [Legionella pneumophila]HBC0466023.1 adenylate/guanylate cyclase domain-containing protein [Legionella pneumophila]HBD9373550.1 adenylate/guanylate cyclase domain-containing protein [Legionella pneumophila]HBI2946678.1 adenylate/guanylate cyclase domain-containing protein [Legionella pneumophila]